MLDVVRRAYEQLVTREWDERLRPVDPEFVQRTSLHPADAHEALTRHIAALARVGLAECSRLQVLPDNGRRRLSTTPE
jgi:hypothetical protein